MSEIIRATLPKTEKGNDANDNRDDQTYLDRAEIVSKRQVSHACKPRFDLNRFALNGQSKKMEEKMLKDRFIIGRIAILGQSTAIYAPPNAGKTLLMLWLLIDAIKAREINGSDVYFINADDNYKGAVNKLKLAEQHGFKMLVPSFNDFKADMLLSIFKDLCDQDEARGKVFILDTVKKFTDIMSKKNGTEFGKAAREFVSHGGSIIMLGHTNKHANEEGQKVHAGTTDLVDDADCAYMLEKVADDASTGKRSVRFSNFKCRGDNALEALYEYDYGEGRSYVDRLNSVRPISDFEKRQLEVRQELEQKLANNREAIDAIRTAIQDGKTNKTTLVTEAMKSSGISKKKILKALGDHEGKFQKDGKFWTCTRGADNANIYTLNTGF